jgi:hypothetical protein
MEMEKLALKITSFFLIACFLGGCVSMQNLTVDDLKKPENLRREKIYTLKISKIQKAIFEYSEKCGLIENIIVDPENSKYGKIAISTMGLTQLNVGTLIEFHEKEEQTEVKVWSFHEHWTKIQADKILGAIENPKSCR